MSSDKSVFLDLEIDPQLMIDDPDEFARLVYEAADNLLNVLNSKTSGKAVHEEIEKKAKLDTVAKKTAKQEFDELAMTVYENSEMMDMHELYHTISEAKKLVKDLEIQFHTRARNQMILDSPNVSDKRLAHEQYKKLRDGFDAFCNFQKLVNDKLYNPLQAKTGNYGSDTKTTYPTYRYDGNVYNNYRAVARLLDWNPDDFHSHSDFTEALENKNITVVEVVQVTL